MEINSEIKILPEGLQTYHVYYNYSMFPADSEVYAEFKDKKYESYLRENNFTDANKKFALTPIEFKNKEKRIFENLVAYKISELKNIYVCKEYLRDKYKLIIENAEQMQKLIYFLNQINELKHKIGQIDGRKREGTDYEVFTFKNSIDRIHLCASFLESFNLEFDELFDDEKNFTQEFLKKFYTVFEYFSKISSITGRGKKDFPDRPYVNLFNTDRVTSDILKRIFPSWNEENTYDIPDHISLDFVIHTRDIDTVENQLFSKIIDVEFHLKNEILAFCTSKLFLCNEYGKTIFVIPAKYYRTLSAAYTGLIKEEKRPFPSARNSSRAYEAIKNFLTDFNKLFKDIREKAELELKELDIRKGFIDLDAFIDFYEHHVPSGCSKRLTNIKELIQNIKIKEKLCELLKFCEYNIQSTKDTRKPSCKYIDIKDFAIYIFELYKRYAPDKLEQGIPGKEFVSLFFYNDCSDSFRKNLERIRTHKLSTRNFDEIYAPILDA